LAIAFRASFKKILKPSFPSFFKRQWKSQNKLPEAYVFDGSKGWKTYNFWPPENAAKESFYLVQDKLMTGTANDGEFQEFISDPKSQFLSRRIIKKGLHQENT
jgi:predicted acyl esterase